MNMTNTIDKLIKTILAGAALVSISFAGQGCITGLYDCRPHPSDAYKEICKKDECVKEHEECEEVESTHQTVCHNENGCRDYEGVSVEKGEWYETRSGFSHKECRTVCDKYKTIDVTVERDTPYTEEERHPEKKKVCVHYNSNDDCIGYKTIDVTND